MIEKLYTKYFQKSKSFLYPALGIRKQAPFIPLNTYVSIEGDINAKDMKLVCVFESNESKIYKDFEAENILSNPLFLKKIESNDNIIYIFNFEIYKADWFNFLSGKYSKFSKVLKMAIKKYYGEKSIEYQYIETYLFPENHFDIYSKLLHMNYEVISASGELCDKFNLEKETLKIPMKYLESSNKI